jgi:carbohydrate-binding DOMON domain-containing protein
LLGGVSLAVPRLVPGLKALRGPSYPLLPRKQIKTENPDAQVLIDVDDPIGDDRGEGSATYPTGSVFVPGSFDLTHFTMKADSVNAYFTLRFKALSQPGWHPEYGFQLTFVAIAIDEDGVAREGRREVPANSKFMLPPGKGYEKLLLVGGGVRLESQTGEVLAAYIPVPGDEVNPLGDAAKATISFAIPLAYLGKPSPTWTLTLLVGSQDDHGGAGIGEFRTINEKAGEMSGGGRRSPSDSNVYDTLECRIRP